MRKTRVSLIYLATYLLVIGVGLLFVPEATLKLLLSNGDYGDVLPRALGMVLCGLGLMIVQLIRLSAEALYPGTVIVRVFFCVCLLVFYFISSDPLFLVMLAIVGLGLVLTSTSYMLDRRGSEQA